MNIESWEWDSVIGTGLAIVCMNIVTVLISYQMHNESDYQILVCLV